MVEAYPNLSLAKTFTGRQRQILLDDGAVIYLPTGQTINSQRRAGRHFWRVVNETPRLVAFPSRSVEVAIYPGPSRFFVPNSFDQTTAQQDRWIERDAEKLRKRLGLEGITMWRPEASEITEVIFWYFGQTGVRLLGEAYKEQAGDCYPYIGTSTPTNKSGTRLAVVGRFIAGHGPRVSDRGCDNPNISFGNARWVVPT